MKKITLLFISIISFILSPLTFANVKNDVMHTSNSYYSSYGKTFTFSEKGITFSIFQNGEFDFYINRSNVINTSLTLGGISISYNSGYNYDAYVQYDDYGAIVQIENVPIYYDYYGRVTRIGGVKLNYYNRRLSRIGGLGIYYNPYGYYSHHTGFINSYNLVYAYHPYHSYFSRPYWNNCVVSYNPYRRHYKPYRYAYYHGKNHHYKHHYNKKRSFRNIDSRVSNHDKHGNKIKRNQNRTQDRRLTVNNSTSRRKTTTYHRSSEQNRERRTVNAHKKTIKRNYKPSSHTSSYKVKAKRNSQKVYSRARNVVNKNNLKFKNDVRNRAVQVKSKQSRNSQYSRSVKKNVTKRNSSYQPSKNKRSFDHKRSKSNSRKTVAERSDRGKRKSS